MYLIKKAGGSMIIKNVILLINHTTHVKSNLGIYTLIIGSTTLHGVGCDI